MWWQWLIFALLIVIFPFSFGSFAVWIKRKSKPTQEQEKAMNFNIAKYTLFYWLCDLFYMSIIINSIICKFIFGGLVMLIIFLNLVTAFVKQTWRSINTFFKWGLLQDFLIGIGISIYLIYIIPETTLQEITTSVIAAIYGGVLTLAGVILTINHTNKIREDDNILKGKPIFGLLGDMDKRVAEANMHLYQFSTHENDIETALLNINLINSKKNAFILKQILIENLVYTPDSQYMICEGEVFQIQIFGIKLPQECKLILYILDENHKEWKYQLDGIDYQIKSIKEC